MDEIGFMVSYVEEDDFEHTVRLTTAFVRRCAEILP
jgi:hypothetical protein